MINGEISLGGSFSLPYFPLLLPLSSQPTNVNCMQSVMLTEGLLCKTWNRGPWDERRESSSRQASAQGASTLPRSSVLPGGTDFPAPLVCDRCPPWTQAVNQPTERRKKSQELLPRQRTVFQRYRFNVKLQRIKFMSNPSYDQSKLISRKV